MVIPDSINLKQSDRNVPDGSLQESINMQWRDGANKPIPYRLVSGIDISGYTNIIAHKVGDESQINILGFIDDETYLELNGQLHWIGTITDGTYVENAAASLIYPIYITDGLSFTILNGVIYFMGNGRSSDEEYYYSFQYASGDDGYIIKDMYAWKDVVFTVGSPTFTDIGSSVTGRVVNTAGVIFIRYSLTLKTGEEVMFSTILPHLICGVNSPGDVSENDIVECIHSIVRKNLFWDPNFDDIVDNFFSSVNIYASLPIYKSKFDSDGTLVQDSLYYDNFTLNEILTTVKEEYDGLMYNVASYDIRDLNLTASRDELICLYVDGDDSYVRNGYSSKIDISTIAAGGVMPTDNLTHHKLYGTIGSFNGRLDISNPTTKLANGTTNNIGASNGVLAYNGFSINTEDGLVTSPKNEIQDYDTSGIFPSPTALFGDDGSSYLYVRGLFSYPSLKVEEIASSGIIDASIDYITDPNDSSKVLTSTSDIPISSMSAISSETTNTSIATNIKSAIVISSMSSIAIQVYYNLGFLYEVLESFTEGDSNKYSSENRLQLSEAGEFSVFPVANSYRVGEGKIVKVGSNNVNPGNADIISPLIVGTTDGVYTVNLDPTGENLISSITKTANVPFISAETLEIGGHFIFVSDKGLMAINNGNLENLTESFFADQGDGDFLDSNTAYQNYDACLDDPSNAGTKYVTPSDFKVSDIVNYMKGAIFAYDGRRNNIWCSNTNENFSLVYSLKMNKWSTSPIVFDEAIELFSSLTLSGTDIYSRYLIHGVTKTDLSQPSDSLLVLSGENNDTPVTHHLLTRPIKLGSPDVFKKIERVISRCQLVNSNSNKVFSFGLWGKQDLNKYAYGIPLVAVNDSTSYVRNIRQDIPIGRLKGKYKAIVILQSGRSMPNSSIDGYDFSAIAVESNLLR